MGRPRKSLEDHIRDGTYRADRHGPLPTVEATIAPAGNGETPAVLSKPATLGSAAGKVWDELTRLLAGVLRAADAPLLAELCRWWAELDRVRVSLTRMKPTAKEYPRLLRAAGQCADTVASLAVKFGLTPADRAKMRVVDSGPAKAKVPTRPKTALDQRGKPK